MSSSYMPLGLPCGWLRWYALLIQLCLISNCVIYIQMSTRISKVASYGAERLQTIQASISGRGRILSSPSRPDRLWSYHSRPRYEMSSASGVNNTPGNHWLNRSESRSVFLPPKIESRQASLYLYTKVKNAYWMDINTTWHRVREWCKTLFTMKRRL
jgi:hypothetical protein